MSHTVPEAHAENWVSIVSIDQKLRNVHGPNRATLKLRVDLLVSPQISFLSVLLLKWALMSFEGITTET